jgi:hypothetical protein
MIFAKNFEKKVILGTSDPWSTSHLYQQTREQAYYIVDCQIPSSFKARTLLIYSFVAYIFYIAKSPVHVG